MKLTVEINLDNDEFSDMPVVAITRLFGETRQWLRALIARSGRKALQHSAEKVLQDINGNTVGKARLTTED